MRAAKEIELSQSEHVLIESIIKHIYPEPTEGTMLPIEPGEARAAAGLARKGIVTIGPDADGARSMTFTALGAAVYNRCLGDRARW